MKLFIDTNIYLDYFRAGREGLASLEALKTLLKDDRLKLILPLQTKEEYSRNRDNIVEVMRKVLVAKQRDLSDYLPAAPTIKDWDETQDVRSKINKINEPFQKLIDKYDKETKDESTTADKLIAEVFSLANPVVEDKDLLEKAHIRYLKGHPPRKTDNSYGDAIIWETLLATATDTDLTMVTHDTDFIEERRGKDELKTFLRKEWTAVAKTKKIQLFKSLGEFVNSFEKKQTIKKEIIEKEKIANSFTGSYIPSSVFSSGLPSTFTSDFIYDTADRAVRPEPWPTSASVLDVYSGYPGRYPSVARYCPYCGRVLNRYTNLISWDTDNQGHITCPHCSNKFKLDSGDQ